MKNIYTYNYHLVNYSVIVIGETGAGKTSFIQSVINGGPFPTHEADRTHVVQVTPWHVTNDKTIPIFDQGGHKIYTVTNALFINEQTIVVIVHNIDNESSMPQTKQVYQKTLHMFPFNEVIFVTTHIDKIPLDAVVSKCQNFKDEITCI